MARLKYAGRFAPGSDFFLAHKGFTDAYWDAVRVDNDFIDDNMVDLLETLTTQTYVDDRDAIKAKKVYVDSQDALYIPTSQKGAASGVAPLNSDVQLPATYVPSGILTDRIPAVAQNPVLNFSGTRTVTDNTNSKEYHAATLEVTDPGYPYVPFIVGQVTGKGTVTADPGDGMGHGVYGQAVVFDTANNAWARAVTSGNYRTEGFPLIPWAVGSGTPKVLNGATTLSLYFSLFSKPNGSTEGYVFSEEGLRFQAILFPGVG